MKCISSDSNSIGDNSDHFSTTNLQKQEVYRLAEEEENCTIEHRNFSVDYIVNAMPLGRILLNTENETVMVMY